MVSAKFRASTAHVDISQLRSKLYEIENEMLEHTKDTEGETCEYDLTKHVMNYLPTPVASNTEPAEMTDATKLASKMNLEANTKHLGVQSNDQSGSDMRFSMAVGMTSMTEEDVDDGKMVAAESSGVPMTSTSSSISNVTSASGVLSSSKASSEAIKQNWEAMASMEGRSNDC